MALWLPSYPDLVHDAGDAWRAGKYARARDLYWLAAFVAPWPEHEIRMLENAWMAHERAAGRKSELEGKAA